MASSSRKRTGAIPPASPHDHRTSKDRHVKRKPCDLDFDTLECPVCTLFLSPPVFQCNNGHTACASCCEKLPNKLCPSCALPIGSIRCIAVEKIIESIQVKCKHAARGCKEKLHYTKSDEHEEVCEYRPLHCPLVGCSYDGRKVKIIEHFEKKHGAQVFEMESEMDDEKLLLDVEPLPGSTVYVIVQGCNESGMFLLHHQFDKVLCRFSFFYSSFGLCSRSYRLTVTVDRQGTKHSYSIEAPVSDNQFDKDWLTKMEQQSNFLAVHHYENPELNKKSLFEMDLAVL